MGIQTTQQARLQDDLRGLVAGDVRCDEITSQLYATDAGIFEYRPAGVVWPRSASDVSAVVAYCNEENIPVHPRGSGTTASGGTLGPGIVLDFTRYMKRILHAEGESVLVQPGAIRERLNDILKRSTGRFFAPSTGFMPTDTLGCIVSANVAGPRWLKFGFPRDYVEELEVVGADGTVYDLKETDLKDFENAAASESTSNSVLKENSPFRNAVSILRDAELAIHQEQPSGIPNSAGYILSGVINGTKYCPHLLFSGAEGSLGIITKIKVRTSVRARCSSGVVLLFDTLEKTAESISVIREAEPTLCELLDRRTISLICERDTRFSPFFPSGSEYALLVEFQGNSLSDLTEKIEKIVHNLRFVSHLAFGSFQAIAPEEFSIFSEILKHSEIALQGLGGITLMPLFEDLQVPVSKLPEFIPAVQNLLKKHNFVYSIGGHFGQGQIRIIPIFNVNTSVPFTQLLTTADEIYSEAVQFGGTVASAFDCGMLRTRFLPLRYPKLFASFSRLKQVFDPKGLMNPRTLIDIPEHSRFFPQTDGNFSFRRYETSEPFQQEAKTEVISQEPGLGNQLKIQFNWDRSRIASDVYGCTGCGLCRIRTSGLRMCPSFRHFPDEQASCRSKANVLRGVLDGVLPLEILSEETLKVIGNLCIGCHCCKPECPSGVDIPKLSYRIRSAYAAAHGLSLTDKIISNLDVFLRTGAVFRCPFTLLQTSRPTRWLFEKMLGIAHGRVFPKIERRRFLKQRRSVSRVPRNPSARVVLFVDIFSDCYDSSLPQAACAVLEHNGVEVVIPPRQKASGHLAFAVGDMERAERLARYNTRVLIDYVRQGYRVVTLEPITAVALSREYLWQLDDAETKLVAEQTTDISIFLNELQSEGKLSLDFAPLPKTVGYHAPCRTLALTGGAVSVPTPAEELLHLIPRLKVNRLERGCCGLAGPSGFRRSNHLTSLRLGMPLFLALRDSSIDFGATECNFCRLQLEQGTNKRVWHPVKLLAHAYGLKKIDGL